MEPLCWRILALVVAWLLVSPHSLCLPANHSSAGAGGLSPHDAGLRPGPPLEDLPPPDLIEVPNKQHDPRAADLNATALLAKLGRNFDPHFMSIYKPRHHHHANRSDGGDLLYRHNSKGRLVPKGQMPRALRKMNFKYIRLQDGTRVRTGISSKLKKKLQQFLWAYTACPLAHRWRDLGQRFWPRYLREGYCPPSKTSCSIPPGMTCRPAARAHKTLLRWHCTQGHRASSSSSSSSSSEAAATRQCQWIKVEYPLVTQCSCPGNDSFSLGPAVDWKHSTNNPLSSSPTTEKRSTTPAPRDDVPPRMPSEFPMTSRRATSCTNNPTSPPTTPKKRYWRPPRLPKSSPLEDFPPLTSLAVLLSFR